MSGYAPDPRVQARVAYEIAQQHPPLIVAGMHRSGTGMLSRMLHEAGVNMGTRQEGNYESIHFMATNIRVLEMLGYGWRSVDHLFPSIDELLSTYSVLVEVCRQGVIPGLIPQHLGAGAAVAARKGPLQWGWKDPRNSLLLPTWLSVFPGARLLHIVRDGRDVALSLATRDARNTPGVSHERRAQQYLRDIELWEFYERRIRSAAGQFETYYCLTYEDLLSRPRKEFSAVLQAFGLRPSRRPEDVVSFVDPTRSRRSSKAPPEWTMNIEVHSQLLVELGYI